ncbi:ArsR family transcriptional regulator [Nakamurella silvestris]|nr:ArsR family transcriptional regulator [Nakamurella silvestris]
MTVLRLSPAGLARSRFALSPLAETLGSIMVLAKPCVDPWLASWHRTHRPAFDGMLAADPFAAGFIRVLVTSSWLPDCVVIPPTGGMRTSLADELAEMADRSDAEFRRQLLPSVEASWEDHDLRWLTGRGFGGRAASVFRQFWTRNIEPDWDRRRMLLEREVMYRAGLLAAHGWPRALEQMTRGSAWEGENGIRFSRRSGPDMPVGEGGMVFVPVSLRTGSWLCEAPSRLALVYPARGSGVLENRSGEKSLARLIGAGRARILWELERPATTTDLALALGVSLGTVGGHLAVLRGAGLVDGTRMGRRVVYRRTGTADVLVEGARSAEPLAGKGSGVRAAPESPAG